MSDDDDYIQYALSSSISSEVTVMKWTSDPSHEPDLDKKT